MPRLLPNQPEFELVDGPLAGRQFTRGKDHPEIPPEMAHRFEDAPVPAPAVEQPLAARARRPTPAPQAETAQHMEVTTDAIN